MFPTEPGLSQTFGDFDVYSLPFLQNFYDKNGLPDPNQFYVASSSTEIGPNRPAIMIGSSPNARTNNQDLNAFGVAPGTVDDAELFPDGGPDSFDNFRSPEDAVDPDPSITNDSSTSWDISAESLTNFLTSTNSDLVFFFNLNEQGSDAGLDGIDMLGWVEVQLTGANGTKSYFLGGRNDGGSGLATGPYTVAPTLSDINDPAWAYIHGYITVDSTTGAFIDFGADQGAGDVIGQNLGANQAAFAFTSSDLQSDLLSGNYEMVRVKTALSKVDNGYEQLFILGDVRVGAVVPEPSAMGIWLAAGLFGLGATHRRRRSKMA